MNESPVFDVPQWLCDTMSMWQSRLRLDHERLTPSNDPKTIACVEWSAQYPDANIVFRVGILPGRDAHETIVHELLHLVFKDLDGFIRRHVLSALDNAVATGHYDDLKENLVERLARILVERLADEPTASVANE